MPGETTTPVVVVPGETTPAVVVPGETTIPGVVPGETTTPAVVVPGEIPTPAVVVPGKTTVPGVVPGETIIPGVVPGESSVPAWTGPAGPGSVPSYGGASASVPAYTNVPSVTVGRPSPTGAWTRVTPTFTNVVTVCNAACEASKASTGLVAHTSPASGSNKPNATPSPSIIPFNAAGRATLSGVAVVFGAICAVAMQI